MFRSALSGYLRALDHSFLITRFGHSSMSFLHFGRLLAMDCDILGLDQHSLQCTGRRYGSSLLGTRDTCRICWLVSDCFCLSSSWRGPIY